MITVVRPFAVLVAVVAGAPAAAQMPISPLRDIYESYNDCFEVATKDGFKPETLGPLGWSLGTMRSADGKPLPNGPIIYGHSNRKPIIILSPKEDMCTVMARIESVAAFSEFTKAWSGQLPKPDKNGMIGFYAEGHPIFLRETGTETEPALTISVMTPKESK